MDIFDQKIDISIPHYEAVIILHYLGRINSEDTEDQIEQNVLFRLECDLEKLIFRDGTPDLPPNDILQVARKRAHRDLDG